MSQHNGGGAGALSGEARNGEHYQRQQRERRPKIINDALHGIIDIEGRCLDILDTPQFQRLRHIRQLQACHYVYPSAQHTRLEHCLGTFHLAGVVLRKLKWKQPRLNMEEGDMEVVQMAALCHDMGHGCFSHMLDYDLFPRLVTNFNWEHEKRSCEILEYMVEENSLDLDTPTIKTIQSLILGDRSMANVDFDREEKQFLWDIVANSRHGIDVDKFDYIARDGRECNIRTGFDHQRVMELMRVVDDEICFNSRGVESVYDLFHARSRLYRTAYFHKATRSIERMIADALCEANHVLKLQDCVHNVEKFCKLDDTILREVSRSTDPSLAASRELIWRIETRHLYKYVDEFVVPLEAVHAFKPVTVDDIWEHKDIVHYLKKDSIIVENLKIDYGRGDENPVDRVGFFDDRDRTLKKYLIPKERVSNLLAKSYKDVTVRLYIKEPNSLWEDEAREMFSKFQTKTFGREVMRTPSLKRKASDIDGEEEDDVYCSQTQPVKAARQLLPGAE